MITKWMVKIMNYLPTLCPSCRSRLSVKRLTCERCRTEVEGAYALPPLARLSCGDQAFVVSFVKASGSLKEMARLLGFSYPTVRNRLDGLIERLAEAEEGDEKR